MKRLLSVLLVLAMLLPVLPLNVAFAATLEITSQPKSVTVASGETAKVTVKATGDGLTYKWYYKNEGASKFTYTSTFKGNSYSVAMNDERDGRQVYCVVSDQNGNSITSSTATLNMQQSTLKITQQPESVTVANGATAKVTVAAEGEGLKYQWYYAEKNSSKFAKASITSATYSVTMTNARAGRKIYCVITDAAGNKVTSDTVTLNMQQSTLKITQQPVSVTVAMGETAKVTVAAEGEGLKYQWYYAEKNSSTFAKASITSATYSVTMTNARAGRKIYCVITDQTGNKVTSDTVTLNMQQSTLKITQQPVSVTVAMGETAKVTVAAEGEGLKYQWYYAEKNSSTFAKASITSATYSVAMTNARAGRKIYCVITDQTGNKVTSDTVTLNMQQSTLKITQQPVSVTVAMGETAKVTVAAEGEGLKYQWYYAEKNSSTFAKASITSATYSVAMTNARAGRKIYCVITDKYGNKVTSDIVTLDMASSLKITSQPVSVTVASGKTAKVSVNAEGDGLKYKWYYKNSGSSKFSATSSFTGTSYSVQMNKDRAGRQVYCVITDKYGNKVTSDTVTLDMVTENEIPEGLKYKVIDNEVRITEYLYDPSATDLVIPAYIEGKPVTTIGDSAFAYHDYIRSITLPETLRSIEDNAFTGCNDLIGITIPGHVASIGRSAFAWCESLSSVTLPESIVAIGSGAFESCFSIDTINVKKGTYAYQWCLDEGLLTIAAAEKGDYFYNTGSSNAIIIYALSDEGAWLLKSRNARGNLMIPASIEGYPTTKVYKDAFSWCSELTSVTLPDTIIFIGSGAFSGCNSLTSINLPESIRFMGTSALPNTALTSITVTRDSYAHQWCVDNGYEEKLVFVD